ncbi:hypothetical protein dsat_1458 [Alkalidesulfovibrio alkalitolerans DSM 16529]|jgi:TRAP-type C4-dicarboxylate transport system permease small subunit|uniref:Uncharacterized protein n=1 Tax=Alkalidesulfovibrio alkalitolerans DSM 16529 TaxID=1121439 RepID=S7T2C2_9BACT|nr:hypothetical protein [Alkalidesulfovibrio alkalitolerans]EPR30736.1 hypothetical protein dsat_1458 [Alkalidesulfovibrio alkalitolerans DSM 16529]
MIPGETIQSPLPWNIPWWMPDHFVFFGVLYAVLAIIGTGLGIVFLKSLWETVKESDGEHGH